MTFLILVAVVAIAYFAWRIVDQLPDVVYRLSEIQRELAELRRQGADREPRADPKAAWADAAAEAPATDSDVRADQ